MCGSMTIWILFVLAVALSLMLLRPYGGRKRLRLPPGPYALPVIGTLYYHSMWPDSLRRLRKRYGDIITIYIGPTRFILLSSYDVIREATVIKSADFSDRGFANSYMFRTVNPHLRGIVDSEFNESFLRRRTNALAIFRRLGVGRSLMQHVIVDRATKLVQSFRLSKALPVNPKHDVRCAVANVILRIVLNKTFDTKDPKLERLIQDTSMYMEAGTDLYVLDRMPFLRHIRPLKRSYQTFIDGNTDLLNFAWSCMQEHMAKSQPDTQEDFVDCYLKTCFSYGEPVDVAKEHLKYTLRDLLLAGLETTATTLLWVLIKLANERQYQVELQQEVDNTVGKCEAVKITDKLPKLEAFLLETQRYHTITPIAPRHTSTQSALLGFDIPANTTVLLSMYDVHMDVNTWGDPHVFRPERFLDQQGSFHRHPKVIPFSMGKRECIGELLARQELFLFTATLLQNFTFHPPEVVAKISEDVTLGGTMCPNAFKIVAVPR